MAKPRKPAAKKTTSAAAKAKAAEAAGTVTQEDVAQTPEVSETLEAVEDAVVVEEPAVEAEAAVEEDAKIEVDAPVEEVEPEASVEPVPVIAPEPVVVRQGGFFPMLFGGVIAAGLGVAASEYFGPFFGSRDVPVDYSGDISAQAGEIESLSAAVAALEGADNSAEIEALRSEIDAAGAGVVDGLAELETVVGSFEGRLAEVEKRPAADGSLSETAFAAYDREIAELRALVEAQTEAMAAAAAQTEQNSAAALAEARAAQLDAAVSRVAAALENGTRFDEALAGVAQVSGVDIPGDLSAAASAGIVTMAGLQESFPDAARAALAATRGEEDGGGITGFFSAQFGARSVEPREGDDPDAILSRVEAALRDGRLNDAMAELDALPEVGRAAMTDWTGQASARVAALAGFDELTSTLNAN